MAEQKDNSGVLFKNEKKTSDKAPDYSGSVVVDGKEKKIAAWVNKGKDGGKSYFSLKFEEPQQKSGSGGFTSKSKSSASDDDDLPF